MFFNLDTVSPAKASGFCLLLLTTILTITMTSAQEQPYFVDAVEVHVVNIDVVVTDSKDRPVTGLTRDDFELLVDGEPVALSNFFAVSEGRPVLVSGAEAESPEATATLPESQQLNMIVLVDDSSLHGPERREALTALHQFLSQRTGIGQRIMLVRYSDSLEILSELSDDPKPIMDGIDTIRSSAPGGVGRFAEWSRIVRSIELGAYEVEHQDMMLHEIRTYAKSLRHDCRLKIGMLKSFIDRLVGLKGRKAIVFVSDGMPMRPGESLFELYNSHFGGNANALFQAGQFSIKHDIDGLIEHANASRVTFYTMNSGGWSNNSLMSRAGAAMATSIISRDMAAMADINHAESLSGMAEDTGGKALRRASLEAFQHVAEDLDAYYSLGFVPADPDRVTTRKIKVKVRGKGLNLRYRRGFRALSQAEKLEYEAIADLLSGSEENPLQISIEVGSSGRKGGRTYIVPVTVRVPTDGLAFIQDGDSYRASLVIHVTGEDARGTVDPYSATVPISLPEQVYTSGGVPEIIYEVELRLRKGMTKISVSVADELGGDRASAAVRVEVAKDGSVAVQS
jgi:VWFA-related protein